MTDNNNQPFAFYMHRIRQFLSSLQPQLKSTYNIHLKHDLTNLITVVLAETMAAPNASARLAALRAQLWGLHDTQECGSIEQKYIRLMLSACYDEEAAEFATFGPDALLDTLRSLLADVHPDLPIAFDCFRSDEQSSNRT